MPALLLLLLQGIKMRKKLIAAHKSKDFCSHCARSVSDDSPTPCPILQLPLTSSLVTPLSPHSHTHDIWHRSALATISILANMVDSLCTQHKPRCQKVQHFVVVIVYFEAPSRPHLMRSMHANSLKPARCCWPNCRALLAIVACCTTNECHRRPLMTGSFAIKLSLIAAVTAP